MKLYAILCAGRISTADIAVEFARAASLLHAKFIRRRGVSKIRRQCLVLYHDTIIIHNALFFLQEIKQAHSMTFLSAIPLDNVQQRA